MSKPTPAAEVVVITHLARSLIAEQHPGQADLRVTGFANGWDSTLLRLGDELLVWMPWREAAARLVTHEQRWLPTLAPRLPLPVPVPVR